MTEAEWDVCSDPQAMLNFLRGRASERKLRLFLVACCRRVWHLFTREQVRAALATAEDYADGRADRGQLREALRTIHRARSASPLSSPWEHALMIAGQAAVESMSPAAFHATYPFSAARAAAFRAPGQPRPSPAEELRRMRREEEAQCALLRDLFRPFAEVQIQPQWLAWQGGTVTNLARAVYDERRFEDLPVLADALEDAGCTDAVLLAHGRTGGEHARGCWLVDAVLAKS
jgi:hypothetical protein